MVLGLLGDFTCHYHNCLYLGQTFSCRLSQHNVTNIVTPVHIWTSPVRKPQLTRDTLQIAVPEPANRVWKEVLSASYSSSTSGNWSWDASDQSVPSTPSPPLSNDANKNFLLSSQGDDVSEDVTESTHFMFEDPIPRKRKVKVDVLWDTGYTG